MGAKSFIGTPEMRRFFVINDKLVCTMEKCTVSMAIVNVIIEHGGVHISAVTHPRPLVSIKSKDIAISS